MVHCNKNKGGQPILKGIFTHSRADFNKNAYSKMQTYVKDVQFDLIVPGVKAISHKQALLTMAQKR